MVVYKKSFGECFNWVVKGGYIWTLSVNLIFKKRNLAFLTLLGFSFLEPLANLDSCLLYHQENVDENISKKKHFLYTNKIAQFCVWKQLEHHHLFTGYFTTFQAKAPFL